MGGGVPGHSLDGHGGVDELFGGGVFVVGVLELLGQPQSILQSDVQRPRAAGDQLGQGVHLAVGHPHHPANVPDGAPGGHGAEGDDLGHVVLAVLALDVVDDLLPPAGTEVNVDIGHGHPLRVEEPLEVQPVLHGVHVGDIQAVGHHGPRRRSPARPHRDAVSLGVADEVGDDQKVVHKAHLADHVHLVVELFQVLRGLGRVAPGEAVQAQLAEVCLPVGPALGELEQGQVVLTELKLHIAQLGDFRRVFNGLWVLREQGGHLRLRFDKEFLGLKAHPAGLVQGLACLDAHEDVLGLGVLPAQVVGVVGGDEGDARLLAEADDLGVHLLLGGDAVVLEL